MQRTVKIVDDCFFVVKPKLLTGVIVKTVFNHCLIITCNKFEGFFEGLKGNAKTAFKT